jgi:protein-S-isoprenylcysteine O-methyltransferase Ste14
MAFLDTTSRLRPAVPVASAALLLWACVSAFPHQGLRAHAAVAFALHWALFLPSTSTRRDDAPFGGRCHLLGNTTGWGAAAGLATLFNVALGLARLAGAAAGTGSSARWWAGKYLAAAAMVSVWAVVRAVVVANGRRWFPHWRHGMTHHQRFLSCSVQAAFVFAQGAPLWLLASRAPTGAGDDASSSSSSSSSDSDSSSSDSSSDSNAFWSCSLSTVDALAVATWMAGIGAVVVADAQRRRCAQEAREDGDKALVASANMQVTVGGLWKYCRHPDYFGAAMVWLGVALFCMDESVASVALFGGGSGGSGGSSTARPTTAIHNLRQASLQSREEALFTLLLHFASPVCTLALLGLVTARGLELDQRRKLDQIPWYRSYVADTPMLLPYLLCARRVSSLEAERDADRNAFHQPSELGRYKSSRADTILEALAASKKKKIEAREAANAEQFRDRKNKQKLRAKTPDAAAGSARRRGGKKTKKNRVVVQ